MINKDYLKNLNGPQKEAVLHLDGPLLIVAGAGSGKTKVLTSRIANIIKEKKAFPNQILDQIYLKFHFLIFLKYLFDYIKLVITNKLQK